MQVICRRYAFITPRICRKYAEKYARKYAGKYAGKYARKYAGKYARKYDKYDEVNILHIFGKYALPNLLMPAGQSRSR